MSTSLFNLIHCDVWGPFTPCTVEGYKYFLTIVNDHSHFTWVYLLRAKSNVATIFPDVYTLVSTQFKLVIKAIWCDNALELDFSEFFRAEGH